MAHLIPTRSYSKLPEAANYPGFPTISVNGRRGRGWGWGWECHSDIFLSKNFFSANGVKRGK